MTRWLALCAVLAGCSLYGREDEPEDKGWPGDDLPVCATDRRAYRIDRFVLPANSVIADGVGWDLDGDGSNDNQLYNAVSAIVNGLVEIDLQSDLDIAMDLDLVEIGVTVDACASPGYALISVVRGLELDRSRDPPRMLADQVTSFPSVASTALPAAATDGTTRFPVGQLFQPSVSDWIDARRAVVAITAISDDEVSGMFAASLDGAAAFDVITRAFFAKILELIAQRGLGDELVQTLFGLFDNDVDGEITLDEVDDHGIVRTILRADFDDDGDGEEDGFSIGVGFHAEAVELFLNEAP